MRALRAFIDDSGSGGDSRWFVLAGYLGAVESWGSFDRHWRTVLDGPPRLDYFKHSEVYRSETQWAGMSLAERDARVDALIEVIGKCALRSIYVQVKQQDYDEIIKPYTPPQWRNPYYYLFIGFLSAATMTAKYLADGDRIEFFFDSNREVEKASRTLYGQAMNLRQLQGRIENIHYKDEKLFLPLQAADLLAWQVRRRFSVQEEPRPHFERAINCPPGRPFHYTVTRVQLEQMGRAMDDQAMLDWAISGRPEHLRPWRRPRMRAQFGAL
jgi:hypothetical protein